VAAILQQLIVAKLDQIANLVVRLFVLLRRSLVYLQSILFLGLLLLLLLLFLLLALVELNAVVELRDEGLDLILIGALFLKVPKWHHTLRRY